MRIVLEIPDEFAECAIRVFAGTEIVARKWSPRHPWEIKTRNCSYCGKCCMNVPENWMLPIAGKNPETGHCKHLVFDGSQHRCSLEGDRPFSCCYSDGIDGGQIECTIIWQDIIK